MRHTRTAGLLATALALVTACTGAATPAPTSAPTSAPTTAPSTGPTEAPTATPVPKAVDLVIPKPSGDLTVKIGIPSVTSLPTVPLSITVDRLKGEGWKTELVEFTGTALNTQALAQGDLQFAQAQVLDIFRAIEQGGQIGWLAENNRGEFVLMAKSNLNTCQDLNGQRLGVHGAAAPVTVLTQAWVKTCGAEPTIVVIPGGDNRAVAMENDQLDVSIAQMADWLALEARSGSKFHLIDTGTAYAVSGAHIWANRTWASSNGAVATAFMAEILKTYRMVHEDPAYFKAQLLKYMPGTDPNLADGLIQNYFDFIHAWPIDGGNTEQVQAAINAYLKAGEIKSAPTVQSLTLDEIRDEALKLAGQAN